MVAMLIIVGVVLVVVIGVVAFRLFKGKGVRG
jgi:hypothetical protein